jgi:hypothetical protein
VQAARERPKQELGVYATDDEVEAARKKAMAQVDPTADWTADRERTEALSAALAAVYDQGQDPAKVFQSMVKPHGIDEGTWTHYLYKGQSREQRQKIAKSAPTLEDVERARNFYDARPTVENQKLDAAVDDRIASADPMFQIYLKEWNTKLQNPDPKSHWISLEHKQYIDSKRAAWWNSEVSKLTVTLSDPSLVNGCGLSALGVRPPASQ